MVEQGVREQVRARYAAAAVAVQTGRGGCCDPTEPAGGGGSGRHDASCCGPTDEGAGELEESCGAGLYGAADTAGLPAEAVGASLGCGNPVAVAELCAGERVLDLGSGGGIDVLLAARRVGPTGQVYGLDMTAEMLALARTNAATAGADNVEFLHGSIEAIPLPEASVDVVISNCVINLSADKPAVLAEMFRVLVPGGRVGVADVVADDDVTSAQRAERGSYVGCIAGALSRSEYLAGLAAAGFVDAGVEFTYQVVSGLHGAIVRAVKPTTTAAFPEPEGARRPAAKTPPQSSQWTRSFFHAQPTRLGKRLWRASSQPTGTGCGYPVHRVYMLYRESTCYGQ